MFLIVESSESSESSVPSLNTELLIACVPFSCIDPFHKAHNQVIQFKKI